MPKFLAIIMEMVATSTLCLNVYSSLVLSALISTAKASLWSMAWIKSFVILRRCLWIPVSLNCYINTGFPRIRVFLHSLINELFLGLLCGIFRFYCVQKGWVFLPSVFPPGLPHLSLCILRVRLVFQAFNQISIQSRATGNECTVQSVFDNLVNLHALF